MDITVVSKNIIRIKGKHSALLISLPEAEALKVKTQADVVLLLSKNNNFDSSKVEGQRLIINGAGEYEVSGVKITSLVTDNNLVHNVQIDGLDVLLSTTDGAKKIKDKLKEQNIVILNANSDIDSTIITAVEPKVAIFYGEKAQDAISSLGKTANTVAKYSTTLEKLPAEMEAVLLE